MYFKRVILFFSLYLAVVSVYAVTKTASVTGAWSNTATWGGAAALVSGGGDDIVVNTGITVTMDATFSESYAMV